jgi:predicted  nucleic acid-binding Zn-ribbon protein
MMDKEKRRYIRLNAVFPVEFQFLDAETGGSISDIKQGFTMNVGKGGICLEVNNIEEGFEQILEHKSAKLDLCLHMPLSSKETKAIANIAWYKKVKLGYPNKYLIGLSFVQIDSRERQKIYFHAIRVSLTPKVVSILTLSLIAGLAYFYFTDFKLRNENRNLVQQLVQISSKKAALEKEILKFDTERIEIEEKLSVTQKEIKGYEDKVKEIEVLSAELMKKKELIEQVQEERETIEQQLKTALLEKTELLAKVEGLSKETLYLRQRISKLSEERVSLEDNLKEILSSFEAIEDKNISNMYKWIKNHQNTETGLVVSYEGDRDLKEWAFTYDQSLACQCFILIGDQDRAERIFNFYKRRAEKKDGGFTNAYDAYTGSVIEYTVHVGPNIWLGIAMLQYINKFKDEQFLSVAEEIGRWVIMLQKEDKDFGIRGGPKVSWFSTEHNLDAYAFFGMLYKITKDRKYLDAQEKTLRWVKNNAFNRREGRLNRGKGDATIATDTFAWAIAAIGPRLLKELDMDPDQIIDFAETTCLVNTDYARPDGEQLKITGFDFGKYEHLPRGGIVSTEWTAQMVVTLRLMADYHREGANFTKETYYKRKADFYLSELEKMVIASPSKIGQGEGCLPYASQDEVDTGHGWRVAEGARTGSTAGTAYVIFAKYSYNPMMLQ